MNNRYLIFDDTPEEVYLVVRSTFAYYTLRWLQEDAEGIWYWGSPFNYGEDDPCSIVNTLSEELMHRVYEACLYE